MPAQAQGVERIPISDRVALNSLYGLRNYSFPTGTLQLSLIDRFGDESQFDRQLYPMKMAHVFEFNIIAWYGLLPDWMDVPNNMFWNNTYSYGSMRMGFIFLPKNEQGQGLTFNFDLGVDFGLRHNITRWMHIGCGTKLIPFSMAYTNLDSYNFKHLLPDVNGEIDIGVLNLTVGTSPFVQTGFYFNQKKMPLSLDFAVGYQLHWVYAQSISIDGYLYDTFSGEDIEFDTRVNLDNNPLQRGFLNWNGWEYRVGLTLILY